MDQPKIERLLRLMKMLSGNVNYTLDDLARKLELSPRTIYRYLDTFKGAGFAVKHLYGGVYKLEGIPDKVPNFDKLLFFSEDEAYLVNNLIDRLSPTNSLKKGLKEKLAVIYESTNIEDFVDRRSNAAHVEALRNAAQEKKQVVLHNYESGHSHTIRDRLVEPFAFTTDYIEVCAFDLEDLHNKVFKVQRIGEVEILDKDWDFETSHRRLGQDVFRMNGRVGKRVVLRLSVMAKNLLIEEYPLAEKFLTRDGNSWILDTEVYDYAGVCRFYAGLMREIKIIDSEEFYLYVRDYLKCFSNE